MAKENLNDLFLPTNQFTVPVKVQLNDTDLLKLRKFINLHYLGDVDANEIINGTYKSKYPEKETKEYVNATHNINMDRTVYLNVEFDVNGIPEITSIQFYSLNQVSV